MRNFRKKAITLLVALSAIMGVMAQQQYREDICLYSGGKVIFQCDTSRIDRVALENNKQTLNIYGKGMSLPLFSVSKKACDSLVFVKGAPIADLVDIEFMKDGSARNKVTGGIAIVSSGKQIPQIYHNAIYNRYVAHFPNVMGGSPACYYKIDFENNEAFKKRLADGHTLECLVAADYDDELNNVEMKFFAAHENGGTGMMVCKTSNGLNKSQEFTFLPNTKDKGEAKWRWATSGVYPHAKVFYHVVGVWNEKEGKAYIYVNGKQKNMIPAPGELNFAKKGCNWFGIGCDANSENGSNAWKGDIALARVYDAPLNKEDVEALWNELKPMSEYLVDNLVSNIKYLSGLYIEPGMTYHVKGEGFEKNDRLSIKSVENADNYSSLNVKLSKDGIDVVLPQLKNSGRYELVLNRGNQAQDLGQVSFRITDNLPKGAQVIAHRGFWNKGDASQNSVTSLKRALNAQEYGARENIYGSETDLWLTADGTLVVNHDPTIDGVNIEESSIAKIKDLKLANGEYIPQFTTFCTIMRNTTSATKLIIEIKAHSTSLRTQEAASAAVKMVHAYGIEDKVEYISFSMDACKKIIEIDKNAKVAYLAGGVSPKKIKSMGLSGLDYNISEFNNHPEWISQAHELGLTVNVWTIDSSDDISKMTAEGVDFVTTNNPVVASDIKQFYDRGK